MSSPLLSRDAPSAEPTPGLGATGAPSLAGQVIDGRYRLGTRLGPTSDAPRGGDPRVELYTAVQLSLDRTVLVKVLRLGLGASAAASLTTRLRHEAMLLARLDHPNLVRVVDYGVHDGSPYIVRELIEGLSLRRMFAEGRSFTPEQAVPILLQVAEALEHVHQAGIVHRDLAPTKLILSKDGRVRITDLGLAKLFVRGAEEERAGGRAPSLMSAGHDVELPEYAAPEVLLGGAVDRRADLYSLGAIAYRMIAKRVPFAGSDAASVIAARMNERLVPLAEAAGLGRDAIRFTAVIDRLLAVDREQRCSTAAWVGHALRVSVREAALLDGDGRATELATPEVIQRAVAQPEAAIETVPPGSAVLGPFTPVPVTSSRPGPMSVREAKLARDPEREVDAFRHEARALLDAPLPGEPAPRPVSELYDTPAPAHALPDGTAEAVLVADPNATEHARRTERGAEPTAEVDAFDDTALRYERAGGEKLAADDPAVLAVRSRFSLLVERVVSEALPRIAAAWRTGKARVGPLVERANVRLEPALERVGERLRALPGGEVAMTKVQAFRVRLGLPRLGGVEVLALVTVAVLLVVALSVSLAGPGDEVKTTAVARAPEPATAELARASRQLAKSGGAAKAIDQLEQALVAGGRYGDPALHAALAAAYVESGQGAKALQHYALVIGRDASALEDADVASLVGLLGLPKRDGEKVAELVRALGPRAVPALRAVSDDKASDKALKKKAGTLLRAIEGGAAPARASTSKGASPAVTARR